MVPPFVEVVHLAARFHFYLVLEEAPLLIGRPGQVRDTPQVSSQPLIEISLSAIGKLENQPKNWVAIHRTIVPQRHCHSRCLPALMSNILDTIYIPSMLLKYPVKCISPQESSAMLARPRSTQNEYGVYCPLLSEQVVFHWLVLIPTTWWSCKGMQSVSSGAPHPVDLLCFLSGCQA